MSRVCPERVKSLSRGPRNGPRGAILRAGVARNSNIFRGGCHAVLAGGDSREFHCDRAAFERDRDRDADTLAGGFATATVTWERIKGTPAREAARLHAILADRRAQLFGAAGS
jgi:hypothetical protein